MSGSVGFLDSLHTVKYRRGVWEENSDGVGDTQTQEAQSCLAAGVGRDRLEILLSASSFPLSPSPGRSPVS